MIFNVIKMMNKINNIPKMAESHIYTSPMATSWGNNNKNEKTLLTSPCPSKGGELEGNALTSVNK